MNDRGDRPSADVGDNQRYLLVEDNPVNRDLITRQLARLGVTCDAFDNVRAGLEALHERDYRVVLTDLHLPEMDGFDLLRAVRGDADARVRATPVVAISADDPDAASEAGFDDYLSKPLPRTALAEFVARCAGGEVTVAGADEAAAPEAPAEAVLELSDLTRVVGDDAETVADFLTQFAAHATETLTRIESAFAGHDRGGIEAGAHQLVSSALAVGARDLGRACRAIEHAAQTSDDLDPLMTDLRAAHEAADAAVQRRLAARDFGTD